MARDAAAEETDGADVADGTDGTDGIEGNLAILLGTALLAFAIIAAAGLVALL